MIDTDKIPTAAPVYDLGEARVQTAFSQAYPSFTKMYDKMASEHVAAISGSIPIDAVAAVVHIPSEKDYRVFFNLLLRAYGAIHKDDIARLEAEWAAYQHTKLASGATLTKFQ